MFATLPRLLQYCVFFAYLVVHCEAMWVSRRRISRVGFAIASCRLASGCQWLLVLLVVVRGLSYQFDLRIVVRILSNVFHLVACL